MAEDHLKAQLIKEREEIKRDLEIFKSEDPFLQPDRRVFVGGEDSISEYEGHERLEITRQNLESRLKEVELALRKLEEGRYGLCETCGRKIQKERLEAMPTARFCLGHQTS